MERNIFIFLQLNLNPKNFPPDSMKCNNIYYGNMSDYANKINTS